MSTEETFTLEETLAKLTGIDPAKIDWEIIKDPDDNPKAVFFKKDGSRACVFCQKPLIGPHFQSLDVTTTDKGQLYIFFCSVDCFGAPKVRAP